MARKRPLKLTMRVERDEILLDTDDRSIGLRVCLGCHRRISVFSSDYHSPYTVSLVLRSPLPGYGEFLEEFSFDDLGRVCAIGKSDGYRVEKKTYSGDFKPMLYETLNSAGQLHSFNKEPAYIEWDTQTGMVTKKFWAVNGVLHRDEGPAEMEYYPDGRVKTRKWYENGVMSREDRKEYKINLSSRGAV